MPSDQNLANANIQQTAALSALQPLDYIAESRSFPSEIVQF
jgi:hypothetical protein